MNQGQEQTLLQQFTSFLKTYKLVFTAKLSLFHIVLTHQDPKPLSSRIIDSHFQYTHLAPQNIDLNIEKIKIIQRFCLRITQFLQYKLCLLKSLKQQWLLTEISIFQNGLKKFFNQLKTFETLTMVIKKIIQYRNTFAKRVLSKISQKNILSTDQFETINDVFQRILLKNIKNKNDTQPLDFANISIKSATVGMAQLKKQLNNSTNILTPSLYFKKNPCFKISQKINHNNLSAHLQVKQNWQESTIRNKTESLVKQQKSSRRIETQHNEKISKKTKAQLYFQDLKKFLELQSLPKIHNQYMIRKQLVQLNKKNAVMINKFRRKCNENKSNKTISKRSLEIKKRQVSNYKPRVATERTIVQYKNLKTVTQRTTLKLNKPITLTIMNPNINSSAKPHVSLKRYKALTARDPGLPIIQQQILQALGY